MKTYFLSKEKFSNFLSRIIEKYSTYGTTKSSEGYRIRKVENPEEVVWGGIRAVESIKPLLFPVREKVADYPKEEKIQKQQKMVLLGAKGCDLHALKTMDKVFSEEPQDPFYSELRKNLFIISSDCTEVGDSCFCTFMDGNPYPQEDFDINVTPLKGGFVLEIGSEKGENLWKEAGIRAGEASNEIVEGRNKQRKKIKAEIKKKNAEFTLDGDYQQIMRNEFASPVWKEEAETCVGCAGCTSICPTCYCFLLYDQPMGKKNFERIRIWDYCQYAGFARVAGGANPRKKLMQRFRHRYIHKLDYFKDRYGIYACTGCGRCVDVCMGKIDMRKVISGLQD